MPKKAAASGASAARKTTESSAGKGAAKTATGPAAKKATPRSGGKGATTSGLAEKYNKVLEAPERRLARTRLYEDAGDDTSHWRARNAEGIVFRLPKKDAVMVGWATSPAVEVTRSEMCGVLRDVRGFFFLTFVKKNGELRDMYAHVEGPPVGDMFPLADLSLDVSEHRQCRMSSVVKVITSDGRLYVLKKAAFAAVLSDNK